MQFLKHLVRNLSTIFFIVHFRKKLKCKTAAQLTLPLSTMSLCKSLEDRMSCLIASISSVHEAKILQGATQHKTQNTDTLYPFLSPSLCWGLIYLIGGETSKNLSSANSLECYSFSSLLQKKISSNQTHCLKQREISLFRSWNNNSNICSCGSCLLLSLIISHSSGIQQILRKQH